MGLSHIRFVGMVLDPGDKSPEKQYCIEVQHADSEINLLIFKFQIHYLTALRPWQLIEPF